MSPQRIQRKRVKGYRMPEGAIYVGRPTLFGNPWRPCDSTRWTMTARGRVEWCVRRYEGELAHLGLLADYGENAPRAYERVIKVGREHGLSTMADYARHFLRGHDLACYCPLDQPCHADVLLKIANEQ